VSVFDGISCGALAIKRAGIPIDKYIAYEINSDAINISKKNHPEIQHRGDVTVADFSEFKGFDLLIGGSPCQSLSSSNVWLGDGEYGVEGNGKSSLFWEYVRALKEIQPKYFLFENVASMRKRDRDIITQQLGVEPVKVDSQLFSPQKRNRLYWTNIPFEQVLERQTNITMKDILEPDVPDKYYVCPGTLKYITTPVKNGWVSGKMEMDLEIGRPITASCWKIHRADTDNYITSHRTPEGRSNVRRLTPLECERIQTLPDNYTLIDGIKDKARYEAIGNGWTVDVITHIFKGLK